MIKNKINIIINHLKLSMSSSMISPAIMKKYFILIINNKYVRSMPILRSLYKILANNIGILNQFFYQEIKNLNANNKNNI